MILTDHRRIPDLTAVAHVALALAASWTTFKRTPSGRPAAMRISTNHITVVWSQSGIEESFEQNSGKFSKLRPTSQATIVQMSEDQVIIHLFPCQNICLMEFRFLE